MSEVAEVLDIGHSSACAILRCDIEYRKKCAKWVPRQLTDPRKQQYVEVTTQVLQRYEGNSGLLDRMVTGSETWVHLFNPESKRHGMEWKHPGIP